QLDSNIHVESEDPDFITKDDDNDKESADGISASWDNTIWKFLLL
ncbi:27025_t:CDS:1, partial [Racocetra persica]